LAQAKVKSVPVLFVEKKQVVAGHTGGTTGFVPGSAPSTGSSVAASDDSDRDESNKCKEVEGAQDHIINEEDNEEYDEKEDGGVREDNTSKTELTTIAAEEPMFTAALLGNMAFHGTMAVKFARATRDTEAAPNWASVGANYDTWMRTL
jgi:hypothetical protein